MQLYYNIMAQVTARVGEADTSALDHLVNAGHFMSRSDAIRSAIRLLVHTFEEPVAAGEA